MTKAQTQQPLMTGRMAITLAHDVIMAMIVMQGVIWLRYSFTNFEHGPLYLWQASLLYGAVSMSIFLAVGLPRGIWRYTSFNELIQILKAVTFATILFVPILFLFTRLEDFPRLVPILQWPLLVGALCLPRIAYRLLTSGDVAAAFQSYSENQIPILLLGPSDKVEPFIREAQRLGTDRFPYRIVGLIDPDPQQTGHNVRGKRILGDLTAIPDVVRKLIDAGRAPQKLVMADPDMKGDTVGQLLETCEDLGIGLARAPKLTDIQVSDGNKPVNIRPVDLRDLLGRPQKALDREAMRRMIAGKRVLITGAGGTIGSELTRQVAALQPSHIAVLDNSEFNLYQIDLELKESFPDLPRRQILADVRDPKQIANVFANERPEIVFHAAALKHVPIVEDNPAEGMLTNVGGTRHVIDACLAHKINTMVMISTDKAVNPSNMMGASKRIAELYCQAQDVAQNHTQFVTVRFGNVLGSTGSVVPLFQKQLARGGPLTVTHKEMTRYFMTTAEAVELVLQSATLHLHDARDHGTDGRIFVLDMGKPVKISALAERIIQLAGLRPYEDIDIIFTGMRAGEKLHESLFHELEKLVPTESDGIFLAAPRIIDVDQLIPALERLLDAAEERDLTKLFRVMRTLVPEYEGDSAPAQTVEGSTTSPEKAAPVQNLRD